VKVWLDDERPAPAGWKRVYWPDEAIRLLQTGRVTEMSLDHDLGNDRRGTGYDVVVWVEEQVVRNCFTPPKINVHSANPAGVRRMEQGVRQIQKLYQRFCGRVATRYLMGGLFEAPPAMVEAVGLWMRSVYAGHILGQADYLITAMTKRKQLALEQYRDAKKKSEKAVYRLPDLKPGQTIRLPLEGSGLMFAVRVRPKPRGNSWEDDEWLEFLGSDRYEMAVSRKGQKLQWNRGSYDLGMMRGFLRKRTDRNLEMLKERVQAIQDGVSSEHEVSLVEAHLLRKACLKYTSKAKVYKSKAKREFPLDLSGWKYVGSSSPLIDKMNQRIEAQNAAWRPQIVKMEENFTKALKFYKDLAAGKAGQPTSSEMVWEMEKKYGMEFDRYGFWGLLDVWSRFDNKKGPPDVAKGLDPYREPTTLEYAESKIREPVRPGDVMGALKAADWGKITCTLDFKGHLKRGGVWFVGKRLLEVDVRFGTATTVQNFKQGIFEVNRVVRHELQHVGQDVLQTVQGLEENAGLPSPKLRDPSRTPLGLPRSWKEPNRGRDPHELQDVEFYTDLTDAVESFVRQSRQIPLSDRLEVLKVFVGLPGKPEKITARENHHFKVWRTKDKEKWKKAVSEFYKAVVERGVKIPGKGIKSLSAPRLAALHLIGRRPERAIHVNVWDDSPPGAPVYIEGELPGTADFTKADVYNFLAGVVTGAGYEIEAGAYRWGIPSHPKVRHPTMKSYDDAVDHAAHSAFLHDLVNLFTGLDFGGIPLNVYSES